MTSIPLPAPQHENLLPPPPSSSRDINWWGMALVCATEAALFAFLITSYFYLGVRSTAWPPQGIEKPKLFLPSMMTAVLLTSSFAVWWGEKGIAKGRHLRLRIGLSLGVFLGIAFLAIQFREYHEKLRHIVPQTHAYASLFFTITSFHGAHVAFGVLLLAFTLGRDYLGHFDETEHGGVKVASLYWHFVDVVWLFIVASLYVSPRFY